MRIPSFIHHYQQFHTFVNFILAYILLFFFFNNVHFLMLHMYYLFYIMLPLFHVTFRDIVEIVGFRFM